VKKQIFYVLENVTSVLFVLSPLFFSAGLVVVASEGFILPARGRFLKKTFCTPSVICRFFGGKSHINDMELVAFLSYSTVSPQTISFRGPYGGSMFGR